MTRSERFWSAFLCLALGAVYFAKLPVARALAELPTYRTARPASIGRLQGSFEAATLPPAPARPAGLQLR